MTSCDEDAFGGTSLLHRTGELSHLIHTDHVPGSVPLRLDVDDVEAKGILVDDAIDAAVACSAYASTRVSPGTAISHREKKVDDDFLEERRRHLQDTVKQLGT